MDKKGTQITVRIGDKSFQFRVKDAEEEEIYRKASAEVSRMINTFRIRYAGKSDYDILLFVAFTECVKRMTFQESLLANEKEAEQLHREIEDYLSDIEK